MWRHRLFISNCKGLGTRGGTGHRIPIVDEGIHNYIGDRTPIMFGELHMIYWRMVLQAFHETSTAEAGNARIS